VTFDAFDIELHGHPMVYRQAGSGPPVVLVHGTPSRAYIWREVVPTLAEGHAVYVYDLLGFGASERGEGQDVSIAAQGLALAELVEAWELEEPRVAGHDIGGAIVLRAQLLHERRFRRLALIDAVVLAPWVTPTTRHIQAHLDVYRTMPNHIFEQITAAHLRTAVRRDFDPEAFAAYQGRWQGVDGQAAYLQKVADFDEADTREFEPLLGSIGVPVLVLWGAEDAWLDPSLAHRVGDLIPGSEVVLIPGAGHFSLEDAPGEIRQALLDFFRA